MSLFHSGVWAYCKIKTSLSETHECYCVLRRERERVKCARSLGKLVKLVDLKRAQCPDVMRLFTFIFTRCNFSKHVGLRALYDQISSRRALGIVLTRDLCRLTLNVRSLP